MKKQKLFSALDDSFVVWQSIIFLFALLFGIAQTASAQEPGKISVEVAERQLCKAGEPVFLTPKVFDMLLVLLENKGRTIEKDELIKKVWADTYVEEGSLNRNISTLRKALGDDSNEQKFIKTLPKRGYLFTTNVREIFETAPPIESQHSENRSISQPVKYFSPIKLILTVIALLTIGAVFVWVINRNSQNPVSLTGLTSHEREQLKKYSSTNTEALENYVKGRALWHQRSAEGLHQSIIHLENAVKADGNFALAQSALADAYAFDTTKRNLAIKHAEEAIRLDPTIGEPYAVIGFVQMFWEGKLPEANQSFRKAVELSPNYATAHQWYALNLVAGRLGGAALAEMKRALELEPNSLAINADLCQMYYFLQKYNDAITQCKRTLEMDANFLNAHTYLYEIYSANEMYAEAVEEFFKIEQLKSDFVLPASHLNKLRDSFTKHGIREFWKTRIEYLKQNPHSYKLAQYYARMGNKEKALNCLRKSFEKRDFDFVFFQTEPAFRDLDDEPQFIELIRLFENADKTP